MNIDKEFLKEIMSFDINEARRLLRLRYQGYGMTQQGGDTVIFNKLGKPIIWLDTYTWKRV